jgi:dehydrodolichyl diphosphate syntase complex subunit NUS1
VISFLFSVFFRFRRAWRHVKSKIVSLLKYHHRTPEFIQRDTRHLERLPKHLSVILQFYEGDEDQGSAGLEGLVNDVGEIAAWTASAGIPYLSVYERTGTSSRPQPPSCNHNTETDKYKANSKTTSNKPTPPSPRP